MEICPWQSLTSASLSCLKKCSFLFFEQVTLCSFKPGFGCLPIPERMGGEVAICSQSKQLFQSPATGTELRHSAASAPAEASPCCQARSGTPAAQPSPAGGFTLSQPWHKTRRAQQQTRNGKKKKKKSRGQATQVMLGLKKVFKLNNRSSGLNMILSLLVTLKIAYDSV